MDALALTADHYATERHNPNVAANGIALAVPSCMSDSTRSKDAPRRVGRPPAGAKEGEKVKDYPQLSVRVPETVKARLTAVSAVTGLAQWRVLVEAIDCYVDDLPDPDKELVDGISERLLRPAS